MKDAFRNEDIEAIVDAAIEAVGSLAGVRDMGRGEFARLVASEANVACDSASRFVVRNAHEISKVVNARDGVS